MRLKIESPGRCNLHGEVRNHNSFGCLKGKDSKPHRQHTIGIMSEER